MIAADVLSILILLFAMPTALVSIAISGLVALVFSKLIVDSVSALKTWFLTRRR